MMRKRLQPDNPVEWLNRAKSSLALAKQRSKEIYSEDLCFQAQQAAEKAIKAVYISKKPAFPCIHDIPLSNIVTQGFTAFPNTLLRRVVWYYAWRGSKTTHTIFYDTAGATKRDLRHRDKGYFRCFPAFWSEGKTFVR